VRAADIERAHLQHGVIAGRVPAPEDRAAERGEDAIWDRDVAHKVQWFGCNPTSLMCDSRGLGSTPQRYHYYVLLRRRACRVTPPERDILAP
jgi:hypothetical protein